MLFAQGRAEERRRNNSVGAAEQAFVAPKDVACPRNQRPAQGATANGRISTMKRNLSLLMAAGAIVMAPAVALTAAPGGGGPAAHGSMSSAPAAHTAPATPNSPTGNGGGYSHTNSPQH